MLSLSNPVCLGKTISVRSIVQPAQSCLLPPRPRLPPACEDEESDPRCIWHAWPSKARKVYFSLNLPAEQKTEPAGRNSSSFLSIESRSVQSCYVSWLMQVPGCGLNALPKGTVCYIEKSLGFKCKNKIDMHVPGSQTLPRTHQLLLTAFVLTQGT